MAIEHQVAAPGMRRRYDSFMNVMHLLWIVPSAMMFGFLVAAVLSNGSRRDAEQRLPAFPRFAGTTSQEVLNPQSARSSRAVIAR